MALPPQKLREIVLQLLYSLEMGLCDVEATVGLLCGELAVGKQHLYRALERVRALQGHSLSLDAAIAEHSPSYALERIQSVERTILRLGVFELLHDPAIPAKVAINEAVRLARKFSTNAAAAFVNAILDAIYRQAQGLIVDNSQLASCTADLLASEEIASHAATTISDEEAAEECAS